ncbi:MAG: thiamine-phosphate kinase [Nitrospirales bacterium]|nr:thiamine-phosphate kinase [Nitrospirales bacterium]
MSSYPPGPRNRIREFDLIRQFQGTYSSNNPFIAQGIGDDAAILRPRSGQDLLITTDVLCEGIHFDGTTATLPEIGYKAAVANLSDIAAMGGQPQYIVAALAIPPSYSSADIRGLYCGMMEPCHAHEVALVGGDLSASLSKLSISITVLGWANVGRALKRSGAKPGDLLYVTGTLGDSLAGLKILEASRTDKAPRSRKAMERFLIMRHLRPTPRISIGQCLVQARIASSAIDLSDGLSGDIRHLCQASCVGADIDANTLPLSPQCRAYGAQLHVDPIQWALMGGEDYELAFTIPPNKQRGLERLSQRCAVPLTRIGVITPRRFGIRVVNRDGSCGKLPNTSFEHFRSSSI